MYLLERILALFTYSAILYITCLLIAKLDRKYIGRILTIYLLMLTIMAFFYVPPSGADLYRLIPIMKIWASLNFQELWHEMLHSSTPINLIYMHIIGQTKIDGLLPAITAFIFFRNVFYILKSSVYKYNISSPNAALVLFFFMSLGVFIEVISGIRTMLGFSIIAVCVYQEMIEKKFILKNIFWYIIASLIHPAVLVMTLIRFSYLIFEGSKSNYQRISKMFVMLIALVLLFVFGEEYLLSSVDKAKYYIFYGTFSYYWEYLIGVISLLFIFYLILLVSKLKKIESDMDSIHNLIGFCKYLIIFIILFSFEYNTFHRFVIFLSILAIPLLIYVLKSTNYIKTNFKVLTLILSGSLLLIACARGNLTSLKFFIF